MNKICFQSGTRIFSIGEEGSKIYIIESGTVELSVDKNGKNIPIETLGKGAIFGEMALLTKNTRLVNATAIDNCEVYPIDASKIQGLIDDSPAFIKTLLHVMATTVQKLTSKDQN